jgi:Ca2+-binding RTX toxin-like protein
MAQIGVRLTSYYLPVAVPQDTNLWTGAAVIAEAFGGHLAVLTSAEEDAFVRALAGPILGDYWIGLSDAATEGVYLWVTGEPFAFAAWRPGEPNNFDGDEDYVSGNHLGIGWNDQNLLAGPDPLGGYVLEWGSAVDFGAGVNPFRDTGDSFRGSELNDLIETFSGNDTAHGGAGNDNLNGNAGNDRLFGEAGNDSLFGGDGNDRLDGGAGNDRMEGGRGNDHYMVDSAQDRIQGEIGFSQGGGIDTVESLIDFTLTSNLEILRLQGTADLNGTGGFAPESLVGNSGRNTLNGGGGNDQLNGKAGDDVLQGGNGADTLVGDLGADVFLYLANGESNPGQGVRDVINGFDRGATQDIIDLSAIDANLFTGADDAFRFIGVTRFSALGAASAGELRVQGLGGPNACLVEGDRDGNGVADLQIFINLQTAMLAGDFDL